MIKEFFLVFVVVVKVFGQGFYVDINGTSYLESHRPYLRYTNVDEVNGTKTKIKTSRGLLNLNQPMKLFEFNRVLNNYRSDFHKLREPKFVGFDIQDDNIEVRYQWITFKHVIKRKLQIDMEIAVPFLSVPTKKGLNKGRNIANINVAAVILAGVVAIGGTLLGEYFNCIQYHLAV
jgi:hypothetical protein